METWKLIISIGWMLLAMVFLNILDTFVQAIDRHWEVVDKISIAEYEQKYGRLDEIRDSEEQQKKNN